MAAPRVRETYLVADCRERAVVPFLEAHLAPGGGGAEFAHTVRQITTGDFHICRRGAVLACLERKTLADFAASLKDGRHANVEKMRALRAATGCRLFYLVEGPAFPALSSRFARVPFQSLNTAMTNLMVRDGVFVVLSRDEDHTARRLAELLRAFDEAPVPADGEGADRWGAGAGAGGAAGPSGPAVEVPPELVRAFAPPGPAQAAVDMWAALPGISLGLGKRLAALSSIADFVARGEGPAALRRLTTFHGRAFPRRALDALAQLAAGRWGEVLLSGVKGVSRAAALQLLAGAGGLAPLCALGADALAALPIVSAQGRSARFGPAKAARLHAALHVRDEAGGGEDAGGCAGEGGGAGGDAGGEDAGGEDAGGDAGGDAGAGDSSGAEEEAAAEAAAADALLREILLGAAA